MAAPEVPVRGWTRKPRRIADQGERSAVSDAAANLLSFVPSLGTREVLAFGEGVALPTRLR